MIDGLECAVCQAKNCMLEIVMQYTKRVFGSCGVLLPPIISWNACRSFFPSMDSSFHRQCLDIEMGIQTDGG